LFIKHVWRVVQLMCDVNRSIFRNNFPNRNIQSVPLATEPGISLIILTPMKILKRNLNRSTFVV